MKTKVQLHQKFEGTSTNVSVSYDLNNPDERMPAFRAVIAFFAPLLTFGIPAVYLLANDGNLFTVIVLIFVAVFSSLISTSSMLIYNEKQRIGDSDSPKIQSLKVMRSIVVIIMLCATYIPFLSFIAALIFAKKYPEAGFYQKGFNAQVFTFIWSLISLLAVVILAFLYYEGIIPQILS